MISEYNCLPYTVNIRYSYRLDLFSVSTTDVLYLINLCGIAVVNFLTAIWLLSDVVTGGCRDATPPTFETWENSGKIGSINRPNQALFEELKTT